MTPTEIKQIRVQGKLTQKELADKIGCSIGCVRKWEQGDRKPGKIAIKVMRGLL